MKIFVSLLAFAMTLTSAAPSLAAGGGDDHGGGHHALEERMNALFPQPQPQFERRDVPVGPVLTAPAFYASVAGDKALLQWKPVEGADTYHVQVATDAEFKWLVFNNANLKETSFEVTGLEAGKNYFWRVAAVRNNNWSTFRKSAFARSMFTTRK